MSDKVQNMYPCIKGRFKACEFLLEKENVGRKIKGDFIFLNFLQLESIYILLLQLKFNLKIILTFRMTNCKILIVT